MKRKVSSRSIPRLVRLPKTNPDPAPLNWRDVLTGYSVSLTLHATMLLVLCLISLYVAPEKDGFGGMINGMFSEEDERGKNNGIDDSKLASLTKFDTPMIKQDVAKDLLGTMTSAEMDLSQFDEQLLRSSASGAGSGLKGDLLSGFSMPGGDEAVTKGSFSAWTVPSDPKPGEDYLIVIQVEYKSGAKLRLGDVNGTVVGTDKYRQEIRNNHKRTRYILKANQVVVSVPGAERLVEDTIEVRSNILKEEQKLVIVF